VVPAGLLPGDMKAIIARFMAFLGAIAVLVLAIASTNVAGTLLARATTRRREIAVRLAIGASRTQLVRQLLTESVLLFVVAGGAGLVLARWLVAGLLSFVPRLPVQLTVDSHMDWRVFAFALGASVAAGLGAGLVPAWHASRPDLVPCLKLDGGGSPRRQRLRGALLVGQITFSMLLLVVAGLFTRALARAAVIDPGFETRGVHLASFDLELARYDSVRGQQAATTLLDRARALPNAESVALGVMIPLDGGGLGLGDLQVDGRTPPDARRGWDADWNVVSPGYFETLRMPIARGRAFGDADRPGSLDVAIVNETFARALWPGEDPIGRVIRNDERVLTVVGVARDAKYRTLGESPRNFIYVALAQRYMSRLTLMVRAPNEASLGAAMRRMVADVDRALPVLDTRALEEQIGVSLFPQRIALWVAASLGAVALLLALLGIYGVTALSVAQRTREIGVRTALGARTGQIRGLVLKQGAVLAGIGVVLGALLAAAVTRALGALLYGIPPTDLIAFAAAASILMLAALAASWVPARRAASVNPVVALRSE
jgi:predicted permease